MTMTCRELETLIDESLDGALDESERSEFARHLKGCGVCDHYAIGYAGAIGLAKAALREVIEAQSGLSEETVAVLLAALPQALEAAGPPRSLRISD